PGPGPQRGDQIPIWLRTARSMYQTHPHYALSSRWGVYRQLLAAGLSPDEIARSVIGQQPRPVDVPPPNLPPRIGPFPLRRPVPHPIFGTPTGAPNPSPYPGVY